MLETGDTLRTWALAAEPAPNLEIHATALDDHRLAYLTYEGPISGDRGSVTQWDAGEYELVTESKDKLVAQLSGKKLDGKASLEREGGEDQRWIFRFSE